MGLGPRIIKKTRHLMGLPDRACISSKAQNNVAVQGRAGLMANTRTIADWLFTGSPGLQWISRPSNRFGVELASDTKARMADSLRR